MLHREPCRARKSSSAGVGGGSGATDAKSEADNFLFSPPAVSLPKGDGAIRAIGKKFDGNPVTGTGSMFVPIAMPPGRVGFFWTASGSELRLRRWAGRLLNGMDLALPSISGKTDRGFPHKLDGEESDVLLLSGAEDQPKPSALASLESFEKHWS